MKKFASWKLDLLDHMSVDSRLSATDFRVAYRVLHYTDAATGDCFPMQETIIADTGLSERTVRNALTSLSSCGWLRIERTGSRKRGRPKNHYRFAGFDYRHADAAELDATTGIPARMYRQSGAGASLVEHVGSKNTLDKGKARKHATPERGTRIPENFSPDLSVATAEGMTPEEARRSALNFVDYWKNKPGAAARKFDLGGNLENMGAEGCRRRKSKGNGSPTAPASHRRASLRRGPPSPRERTSRRTFR